METILMGIIISLLVLVGILFYLLFRIRFQPDFPPETDSQNIIQKNTLTFVFSNEGILISQSDIPIDSQFHLHLSIGQHISEQKKLKNLEKYFETALKFKKNISLKLFEEKDMMIIRRHDLIFTPVLKEKEVISVVLVLQEIISRNKDQEHLSANKELEEQRNYALKQIDEIEAQKSELEIAFKKSSKHHIMLQKALRKNELQKAELEKALEIINNQKVELEKANKEIKESSRLKEIFLANTSHEIRTPLNAIIGFTNLLLNSELKENQKKYLENIKASGNNLLVVINDILDFSKIESGKLTLEEIEFDFKNLIKHTISTLSVKSQEKGIELKYDISPDIPEVIVGDPVRLNQILINLIGNAIKFTNTGGWVRLMAANGKITDDRIKILFKVEDNGIGIAPDKLAYIFQSFTQGQSDTTRKYGGTGLGLSIVKQLIELQTGEIEVESQTGKGTAFTFYIFMKIGKNRDAVRIKHQSKPTPRLLADHMKILLVEDNLINQQLAYDTIKAWNNKIEIDVAENGKLALEKVEAQTYHLILMDIQMPEMDGIEATQRIRQMVEPRNRTPIVAMTAHALKNEKDNCLSIGMNDYISKPFDPEDLFAIISKFCPNPENITNPEKIAESVIIPRLNLNTEKAYVLFNTSNLKKIYQNNHAKISKIVKMCYESIPNEIVEIQKSFDTNDWEVLRNKAHALKPKLGYLGMDTQQDNAKNIELMSQQPDNEKLKLQEVINEIKEYWETATPEIEDYLMHQPAE
ncbi:MAG TPA: hypothetical protein DCY97_02205 [Marinilabiliales bacterium]|nr:hypothetical protein [Marinilabiliales bacterium]